MSIIGVLIVLVVVGVLLWLVNTYLGAYLAQPITAIINVVVILCVIIWLLNVFGLFGPINQPVHPR